MLGKVRLRPLAIDPEEVLVVAAILLMSKRKWISAVAAARLVLRIEHIRLNLHEIKLYNRKTS